VGYRDHQLCFHFSSYSWFFVILHVYQKLVMTSFTIWFSYPFSLWRNRCHFEGCLDHTSQYFAGYHWYLSPFYHTHQIENSFGSNFEFATLREGSVAALASEECLKLWWSLRFVHKHSAVDSRLILNQLGYLLLDCHMIWNCPLC